MEKTMNLGPFGIACLLALVAASAAGCASTNQKTGTPGVRVSKSKWIRPSPILRQQIEDEAERLPWTHGFERLEQIRWFASVGEPGYETLLELAVDERDDVAAAALAALGATLDKRLVEPIRKLEWSEERLGSDLILERARALLRLGDWSNIPALIEGLKDERLYTRALCLEALTETTHETHNYDPRAEPNDRKAAIERWERWWSSRSRDYLLSAR